MIRKNPVHFLCTSAGAFFRQPADGTAVIALTDVLLPYVASPAFAAEVKDVIEMRAMTYYRRRYGSRLKAENSDAEGALSGAL